MVMTPKSKKCATAAPRKSKVGIIPELRYILDGAQKQKLGFRLNRIGPDLNPIRIVSEEDTAVP